MDSFLVLFPALSRALIFLFPHTVIPGIRAHRRLSIADSHAPEVHFCSRRLAPRSVVLLDSTLPHARYPGIQRSAASQVLLLLPAKDPKHSNFGKVE
jgi:hypothetical protein